MRLQWKYSLVINLTVVVVLVAFYFFDSIRMRREMNALHALGAERGAVLKKIAEVTILGAVLRELGTEQAFDAERLDAVLRQLKQEHPDMKDVINVHVSLDDTRIRSSLLARDDTTGINLDAAALAQIEAKGAKIDTVEGQNATAIVIKYHVSLIAPKQIELAGGYGEPPLQETYETMLDSGSIHFELWKALVANDIYVLDAAVTVEKPGTRWRITDKEKGNIYTLWKQEETLWAQKVQTGYVQVLFNVPDIDKSIRYSLLMHAVLIVFVGALLVILLDLTTNQLVMKPLERMTRIIQNGGEVAAHQQTYSSDEIGRATHNLVRMLWQLRESHSKRIAALGQFAAGIAHEIRNPLNSIGMTAQHLKAVFAQPKVEPDDIVEAKELLDIVNQKIDELKQISQQFLTLNRPRKLNVEPVCLNSLVERVLSEFALIAEEARVQLIPNYDAALTDVSLDAALIRQTLFNLIQNSIQAMPKGGSIYITTTLEQAEEVRFAVIEIRDTGIGIPEEFQEQVYDAYFTTKEASGGVGLGLAISHQIIAAHKGKIEMRSKMGMGTAFKISLPIKARDL